MALIYCHDCRAQISDAAPACPYCGRPIAFRPAMQQHPQVVVTKAPWVLICKIVGALLMFGGFVGCGTSCGNHAGDGVVGGIVAFVIGMLIFVVGRFGD